MPTIKPFNKLGLAPALLTSLTELGYEAPTPVQEESIPILMEGEDLLAQAQTGTGKTAAFALPILSNLNLNLKEPQAIVITPTRELAIQVAEAFQTYAKHLKGFHVTPIYGGQGYPIQLKALKRGVHVIVGTPGRLMDHLRRGTLSTKALKTVILDEADEMLKMGFVEDIEWILEQIPNEHQTGLFSATMPTSIQKIAKHYLKDAKKIHIKPKETTVEAIEQFYTTVTRNQKLEVLTRFLEVEDVQAAIIFTRTKNSSSELAEKLQARGYAAAALNGDMSQSAREKVISRIKKGSLDIIVATDVAARGIDVERVSHVINYDIPHDTEAYIHRIGRTGRAGRKGTALLFVAPREHRLLKDIERAVRSSIKQVEPPSVKEMSEIRSKQLAEKIMGVIEKCKKLKPFQEMVDNIIETNDCAPKDVAAALAYLMQQSNPLPSHDIEAARPEPEERGRRREGRSSRPRRDRDRSSGKPSGKRKHSFKASSKEGHSGHKKSRKPDGSKTSGRSSGPSRGRSAGGPKGRSAGRSNGRSR